MPGARLVLYRSSDEILLQRRSDFGLWGFISGTPDEGETLAHMLVREALEEAGIAIEEPTPFGISNDPRLETIEYPNGDRCQYFAVMYACNEFSGEPYCADSETTEMKWFAAGALPCDLMAAVRPTVDAFSRWKATGQFQNLG